MTRLIFNQLIHLFLKFWKEVNQRWFTNLILMEKKWVFLLELKQWHWLFSQVFPSKGICKVHFSCDQGISFVLFLCFLLHPIDMLVMGGLIFPLNMWRSPFYYSPPQSFLGFWLLQAAIWIFSFARHNNQVWNISPTFIFTFIRKYSIPAFLFSKEKFEIN